MLKCARDVCVSPVANPTDREEFSRAHLHLALAAPRSCGLRTLGSGDWRYVARG